MLPLFHILPAERFTLPTVWSNSPILLVTLGVRDQVPNLALVNYLEGRSKGRFVPTLRKLSG